MCVCVCVCVCVHLLVCCLNKLQNAWCNDKERKFKFHYNLPTITGTLHADRYTLMIISR